jgi:hypothetical protein
MPVKEVFVACETIISVSATAGLPADTKNEVVAAVTVLIAKS